MSFLFYKFNKYLVLYYITGIISPTTKSNESAVVYNIFPLKKKLILKNDFEKKST